MKLLSLARWALQLTKEKRYGNKGYLKKVLACKKAELCEDYKSAYYKLLEIFEDTLAHFGKPMRGNIAATSGAGPHFQMVFNIPPECLNLKEELIYPIAGMWNLFMTGFPEVPANYITRKDIYPLKLPGDTSYFSLWINENYAYLGEMRPITQKEYDSIQLLESWVSFPTMHYGGTKVCYKYRKQTMKYPIIYLECEGHYYKYSWQF